MASMDPDVPRTASEIEALVIRLAKETNIWDNCQIQEALSHLEHRITRRVITAVLEQHGIEPAPERH